jgi:hypothetical protein
MLQTVLILAIVGLMVGHLFRPLTAEPIVNGIEPFVNGDSNGCPMDSPFTNTQGVYNSTDTDDDPRDLPWIASWSHQDRWIRQGQFCAPLSISAGPNDTEIHVVPRSCESGLPHTRPGDRIMISDSTPVAEWPAILKHELVHISQRRHPDTWADFYGRAWAFTVSPVAPPQMPAAIIKARRANPDIFETPWSCWRRRWWPVCIYNTPDTLTLRDAHVVWWDEWKNQISTTPPEEWSLFFGAPAQQEHPHEIAAVMIVAEDTATEAGRRLHTWWGSKGPMLSSP